jgi:molybdopterin converting factor small subunit
MKVDVVYTGQLASIAGVAGETIEVGDGGTLGDLVKAAVESRGKEFSALLCDESGGIRATILVAIDGAQATGDREARSMGSVREVMFMAPVAGG